MGKYLKSVAAALVVVVAFSLGNIRQANAHFADGALIAAAIAALEAAVTYAIEYFSTAYVNMSIQMASSQATAEAEKIVATIAETARGQEVARAQNQLQRDAVAIKEAMKLPPFACQTLAASDATARADDGARDTAKELSLSQSKRGLETTNTAAEVSKLYSDIERARQSAPVSATTLLGPKTYTAAEEASAKAYIMAVTDPMPVEKLPAGWENTPHGRAFNFRHQVYQQRMSLAQASLNEAYAARRAQSGAGAAAGLAQADASAYEIAMSEVDKRVKLPEWKKSIMSQYSDPLPVLKEIALMQGTDLYLASRQLQHLERMETILATSLAMQVRASEEPALQAQRAAAMASQGAK